MSIEELVKKYIKRNGWSFSHDGECADAIRAALTEQAAAYEQRIRELEAQRVPDVRCKCCGYLVTESEHRGCLRAADATAPEGWSSAAQWLRNNYQDHPTISALCEAMIAAGHSADRHDDAKDAERYRWLRYRTSAHGIIAGWTFAFPTAALLPAPAKAMRSPSDALDEAIDAMLAAAPAPKEGEK